ncbi:MAG TPA: menaquinone-dependent protoporphyrinogen IX dehydrogenase [Steroidobacteraceae bacterium]|nr:menaquinone-dependent protoporphyrinogen IX dehydrogenase [Steroidobacteraceae bacterium]
MAHVLLACSSVYGYTRRICEFIEAELEGRGHRADVVDLADAGRELARYDAIVIGASIRHGKHRPAVHDFISEHRELLAARPSAFFSVNLVARKSGKNTPETNPYVRKFLRRIPWKPRLVAVFAGNVDYPRYDAFDRTIIRVIMWLTRGPTDPKARIEFTDWTEVRRFAERITALARGLAAKQGDSA